MPRCARKQSESGIYHVMLRGVNRQQIFIEDSDYKKFIQILKECKEISEFKLYAYCIMNNHIHILIKPENESLERIFKRIGCRFVYWYNLKYQRVGHLFQDRFKSEPVEDDSYLLTVIRYIHQNPVKANLCSNIEDYVYSSYFEYLTDANWNDLIDKDLIYSMMDRNQFVAFNNQRNEDNCLDIETQLKRINVTDEKAEEIFVDCLKCRTVEQFHTLDINEKKNIIKLLYEKGISIRQISRLTGVIKSQVEKTIK